MEWQSLRFPTMQTDSVPFAISLFAGMLLCIWMGYRIGQWRRRQDHEGAAAGLGAIEGAIFGLFGLMIAFTFSGAASRFDARRQLIIAEANAIGSAWHYLDLINPVQVGSLRQSFRNYIDARIASFEKLPDVPAAEAELGRSAELYREIWDRAVKVCEEKNDSPTTMLLLGALNEMSNISTSRTAALRIHPPSAIYALLFGLGLCSAIVAGYGMAASRRLSGMHTIVFAAVIGFCVFVIRDMEYPRLGVIRVTQTDRVMSDLRASMR